MLYLLYRGNDLEDDQAFAARADDFGGQRPKFIQNISKSCGKQALDFDDLLVQTAFSS